MTIYDPATKHAVSARALTGLVLSFVTLVALSTHSLANQEYSDNVIQSHASILHAAREHLMLQAEVTAVSGISIEAGKLDARLRLAECNQPLDTFSPYSRHGLGRTTVGVRCNGDSPWTLYVQLKISAEASVVTLARSLPRGAVLRSEDLILKTLKLTSFQTPYVNDPVNAIGKKLKRALAAGTALTASIIELPKTIRRGDQVVIVSGGKGLQVRMMGEALEDGVVGERVRIRNMNSKKEVEGRVQADGSVRVFR